MAKVISFIVTPIPGKNASEAFSGMQNIKAQGDHSHPHYLNTCRELIIRHVVDRFGHDWPDNYSLSKDFSCPIGIFPTASPEPPSGHHGC